MSDGVLYEPYHIEVDRLLSDPWYIKSGRNGAPGQARSFKPKVDLQQNTAENLVTGTIEFPGLTKEDVQITFQNDKLTVVAETKKSEEPVENGYALRERLYGRLTRTIQLPQGITDEQIKATMENGLLTITFPRTLPELAPKKIDIS